jgi:hypothetical protein
MQRAGKTIRFQYRVESGGKPVARAYPPYYTRNLLLLYQRKLEGKDAEIGECPDSTGERSEAPENAPSIHRGVSGDPLKDKELQHGKLEMKGEVVYRNGAGPVSVLRYPQSNALSQKTVIPGEARHLSCSWRGQSAHGCGGRKFFGSNENPSRVACECCSTAPTAATKHE